MDKFDIMEAEVYSFLDRPNDEDNTVKMLADRKHLTMKEAKDMLQKGYARYRKEGLMSEPIMIRPKNIKMEVFLEHCLSLDSACVEGKHECG